MQLCADGSWNVYRRANRMERKAMQERLQKRYRPQIPCPLSAGEMGPVDLVDVTQPLGEAGPSKKPTMSRAQQLVKKSHIVTAQQKVKVCFKTVVPRFFTIVIPFSNLQHFHNPMYGYLISLLFLLLSIY